MLTSVEENENVPEYPEGGEAGHQGGHDHGVQGEVGGDGGGGGAREDDGDRVSVRDPGDPLV